jgi:hypothetical protein
MLARIEREMTKPLYNFVTTYPNSIKVGLHSR